MTVIPIEMLSERLSPRLRVGVAGVTSHILDPNGDPWCETEEEVFEDPSTAVVDCLACVDMARVEMKGLIA